MCSAGSPHEAVDAGGVCSELLVGTLFERAMGWNRSVGTRSAIRLVGGSDHAPSPKHPRSSMGEGRTYAELTPARRGAGLARQKPGGLSRPENRKRPMTR